MRIAPINFYTPNTNRQTPTKPSFKGSPLLGDESLERGQFRKFGYIYNFPTTYMFRGDLDWREFSKYIKEKYKDEEKVNVYDYACSSGFEAYSISIMLQQTQEKPEKFFPIKAFDIRNGEIKGNNFDKENDDIYFYDRNGSFVKYMEENPETGIKDYIETDDDEEIKETIHITKKATDPIEFNYGNILNDIEKMDDKNPSMVFARNMWPYVDEKEYKEFAQKLHSKLKSGSIVVLGCFDIEEKYVGKRPYTIATELVKAGFKPVSKTAVNSKILPDIDYLILEKE